MFSKPALLRCVVMGPKLDAFACACQGPITITAMHMREPRHDWLAETILDSPRAYTFRRRRSKSFLDSARRCDLFCSAMQTIMTATNVARRAKTAANVARVSLGLVLGLLLITSPPRED